MNDSVRNGWVNTCWRARKNGRARKAARPSGLRSNVIRERAHAFYERHGYTHVKTQKAFRKQL